MRLRLIWLALLVVSGLITGAGLGLWMFGGAGLIPVPAMLPSVGAAPLDIVRGLIGQLAPNELLALACVAAIGFLLLRDAWLDWLDRRRLGQIREAAGLSRRPGRR